MPSREGRLKGLAERVLALGRVLLLIDFDGTLCEGAPRPDLARFPRAAKAALRRLGRSPVRRAVISGRSLPDLRRRVGLPGIIYGGNFGLEISGPGIRFLHPAAPRSRARLESLMASLSVRLREVPGVLVEDKRWGAALHYRSVPPGSQRAFGVRFAACMRKDLPPGLRRKKGERVWEIVPDASWDKGAAALMLWRRLGKPSLLAIGNDATDEPMLKAARSRGIALRVGPKCALRDVGEVHRLLALLAASSRRDNRGPGRSRRSSRGLPRK